MPILGIVCVVVTIAALAVAFMSIREAKRMSRKSQGLLDAFGALQRIVAPNVHLKGKHETQLIVARRYLENVFKWAGQ